MNLFVLLATRNREALLERTLSSLASCRRPQGYQGTWVVENGARGATEDVVRRANPDLKAHYLFEAAGNKSRALNAAMAHISDGLILFLDDDVRVGADLLELHAAAAERAGAGHFFGGPVAPDYEAPPPVWLMRFLPASAKGWEWQDAEVPIVKPVILGCNWAAFAADIRAIGGFSEQFGPGSATGSIGQESQMQRRLLAHGLVGRYVPGALVYHWVPGGRCSPEFALERIHKDGIRSGLLRYEDLGIGIAGYPVVLLKRTFDRWLYWHYRRLSGNAADSFAAQVAFRHRLGVLKGVRLSRRSRASGVDTRIASADDADTIG